MSQPIEGIKEEELDEIDWEEDERRLKESLATLEAIKLGKQFEKAFGKFKSVDCKTEEVQKRRG